MQCQGANVEDRGFRPNSLPGRIRLLQTGPARRHTVIKDSVVVFEVLSPGTSHTDRIEKLREYQATPSIQRYVILEQDSVAATVFARRDEDCTARPLIAGDILEMPEIGVVLPLYDIYADVEMAPPDAGEAR
jgi:Uma2 family endonuclease